MSFGMKNNMNKANFFINSQVWFFSIILSLFSGSTFSRTLIFQSDTNSNQAKQSTQTKIVNSSTAISPASVVVPATSASNSANSELFFMIEQLQKEVNSLRGLLEEQGHELRMLKQSSRDRYLDIDTRVLDLTKRMSISLANNSETDFVSNQPISTDPLSVNEASLKPNIRESRKVIPVVAEPIKEREPTKAETDDYQKAYAFIKNKQYDDSILALFAYTENYPDSPLLANVYYWLGEVYLATSKYEQAKTSFSLVVSAYPNSQKVSDSLYKLAVTSDFLGDKGQAEQYINDVLQRYPESNAAKLAKAYKVSN